jgi:hypothetical protein
VATLSHQTPVPADRQWRSRLLVPEMWTALAITVMWLVVLFDALFGPDIVASNAGTSFTRIPSAIVVAFFVYLATRVVAKYGFSRPAN